MTQTKSPITSDALSRIHSTEAKKNGGAVEKGSFTTRVQRALTKNTSSKGKK